MQWPSVFLLALRKNTNPERYRGTLKDERRLFYVAPVWNAECRAGNRKNPQLGGLPYDTDIQSLDV